MRAKWILQLSGTLMLLPSGARAQFLQFPCATQSHSEQVETVSGLFDRGMKSYKANDLTLAAAAWSEAKDCSPKTPAWPLAVYDLAVLEKQRKNYTKAIEYFKQVIQSRPNDREPGQSLMEAYRNYSHRSALGISECYESMGDLQQALRFAVLARTGYPYLSWCRTCLLIERSRLDRRIAVLTVRAHKVQSFALVLAVGLML